MNNIIRIKLLAAIKCLQIFIPNILLSIKVAAVKQFLESDSMVHVMRDHPAHGSSMLGGTWGAKVIKQRKEFFLGFKSLFKV